MGKDSTAENNAAEFLLDKTKQMITNGDNFSDVGNMYAEAITLLGEVVRIEGAEMTEKTSEIIRSKIDTALKYLENSPAHGKLASAIENTSKSFLDYFN